MNREEVLRCLQLIPPGRVATYGQIAALLGCRGGGRAVGNILHRNPDGNRYPCYKVVNARGRLSGSYAFGGMAEQRRRLLADGIEVCGDQVDLEEYLWQPDSSHG